MGVATDQLVPLPRALQIEVTGSCNLSCQMCLVAYRPRLGRSAHLDQDRFRELLDEVPTVEEITLQGLGEPLLVPHLEDMVAEASSRGIRVGFNTNGTLLDQERAASLLAAGVDWLHVSIDGASAETFEAIRHGARHDVVVDNLRGLTALRRHLGATRPFVQLNTVAMRGNLHELVGLVRLAADLGVDRLWFQGLSHDFRDVEQDPEFLEIRRWTDRHLPDADELRQATAEAARLAAELGLDIRFPADGEDGPRSAGEPGCDWPWRSAYVTYDGRVQACCMLMGRDRGVVGSIGEGPFGELWNGEPYRRLREQLTGDEPPDMCAGCAVYRRRF